MSAAATATPAATDTPFAGSSVHIPGLDGPASSIAPDAVLETPDTPDETPPEGEQPPATEQPAEGTPAPPADPVEALIQQFAKEHGADPTDPSQRKWLKRMADKELHIQKLQGERAQPQEDILTPFERELAAEAKKAEEAARQTQQPPVTQPPNGQPAARTATEAREGAVPQALFNTPAEYYKLQSEAFTSGDTEKLFALDREAYLRNAADFVFPYVSRQIEEVQKAFDERIEKAIEDRLGDVLPAVRQQVEIGKLNDARNFALDQLAQVKGMENVRDLFKAETGATPLEYNGEKYPDTPMNRAIRDNPWIMHIQRDHDDPATAAKLTFIARFQAAWKYANSKKVDPETAQNLVQAGQQMAERKIDDRTRQSLNAGRGATTSGGTATDESFMKSTILKKGDRKTFADL